MACADCGTQIQVVTCSVRCGVCRDARVKSQRQAGYQRNKHKWAARHKERYSENPEKYRGYHYKHRYGITRDEVAAMHAQQGRACAICGKDIPLTGASRTELAVVDHCHSTGKVRGLLCRPCNLLIGHAGDSTKILSAAIAYLGNA